jgi:hypothetical protein
LSVSDSARLHLWAQLNVSNVELVRQPEFGNRSPRLLVAEPRMRRASKEKECRALLVSSLLHNSPSSRSSASKVARLPQSITARHKDSQKAGSRDNQRKRHRHGHNDFGAITPAAPEVKLRSRFSCLTLSLVGRLCQTPIPICVNGAAFHRKPYKSLQQFSDLDGVQCRAFE